MGTIHFLLPPGPSAVAARELERACMTGGPDNMPWPTEIQVEGDRLTVLRRDVDESGCLLVPWPIEGTGLVMGSTATLMERSPPYLLTVELTRGKVNQVRSQAWDWLAGGLQMPASLEQEVRDLGLSFGRAATQEDPRQAGQLAQQTLTRAYRAAEQLVRLYWDQVFQVRHQRQARLDTTLGCRLGPTCPRARRPAPWPGPATPSACR